MSPLPYPAPPAEPHYLPCTMRVTAGLAVNAQQPHRRLVLAVDFDGTLAETDYPLIIRLLPGAKEAMLHFKAQGHTLIIWTCRGGQALEEAVAFLWKQGVPFDYVNENVPALVERYGNDSRKVGADLYLDDRGAGSPSGWRAWRYFVNQQALAPAR